eukprot:scaffold1491_cov110-Isochrysis_galbana.AAC.3
MVIAKYVGVIHIVCKQGLLVRDGLHPLFTIIGTPRLPWGLPRRLLHSWQTTVRGRGRPCGYWKESSQPVALRTYLVGVEALHTRPHSNRTLLDRSLSPSLLIGRRLTQR